MILHSKILGDSNKHILILHGFLGSGDNSGLLEEQFTKNSVIIVNRYFIRITMQITSQIGDLQFYEN